MAVRSEPSTARAQLGLRAEAAAPLAVAGLTAAAFLLRLRGMDQSLFGDELYTYAVATQPSLDDVVPALQHTENNPPLFYVLSWAAAKLGDPTVWMRLPSLIAGTAVVPVMYVLGRRTVGRTAALLATAFIALGPFAIFYSSEGRAYATLIFLVTLSTLLLLVALERGGWRWWIAYGVCAALVLYTHYTGLFPLAAQAIWALWTHRERLRELLIVYPAVAIAYAPWLPYYADQKQFFGFQELGAPLSLDAVFRGTLAALYGHPYIGLKRFPGDAALVLLGVATALVLATAALLLARRRADRGPTAPPQPGPRLEWLLLGLVGLSTPLALVLYSLLGGPDIWAARNLSASLPALMLLMAALLVSRPRPAAAVATALVLIGLAIGTAKSLDPDYDRPPVKQAAQHIDARARASDAVIDILFQADAGPLGRGLALNFERPRRLYTPGVDDDEAWQRAAKGAHVFLVVPQVRSLKGARARSGPGAGYPLRSAMIYRGFLPIGVFEYGKGGREGGSP
jgi:mannosyltransferase